MELLISITQKKRTWYEKLTNDKETKQEQNPEQAMEHGHHACPCNPKCAMKRTVELIGGKWKLQIICSLSMNGTSRYSELKRALPGITNTMLSNSLKELENDRLVVRNQYNEMPLRVEYSISPETEKLLPILAQLAQWTVALETAT